MKNRARITNLIGRLRQTADRAEEIAGGLRSLADYAQAQVSGNCTEQLAAAFEKRSEQFVEQLEQLVSLLSPGSADHGRDIERRQEDA